MFDDQKIIFYAIGMQIAPSLFTIKKRLQLAHQHARLAHALLFVGDHEAAKEGAAQFVARLLLCRSGVDLLAENCVCGTCLQIAAGQHQQVRFILSEAEELRRSQLQAASSSDAHGSRDIKIDQLREIRKESHMRSFQDEPRLWILVDGHRMTQAAANSILKTLEEPHSQQYWIIFAPSLGSLLPTITSRCQRVFFPAESVTESASVGNLLPQDFIAQIINGDLCDRLACLQEIPSERDAAMRALLAIETHVWQCITDVYDRFLILSALEQARLSLKKNVHVQLVLETLILQAWPRRLAS